MNQLFHPAAQASLDHVFGAFDINFVLNFLLVSPIGQVRGGVKYKVVSLDCRFDCTCIGDVAVFLLTGRLPRADKSELGRTRTVTL
jgi:hypothetical protein